MKTPRCILPFLLLLAQGCAYSTQNITFQDSEVTVDLRLPPSAEPGGRPVVVIPVGTQIATPIRSTPMDILGLTGSAAVGPGATTGAVDNQQQKDQSLKPPELPDVP